MKIIRVNKSDQYDIFIGRPSKFSNPFIVGKDGSRTEVLKRFRNYMQSHPELNSILDELQGKKIACWCDICEKCHGDILIELFEDRKKLLLINDTFE
jgi:hypothetical protein